MSVTGGIQSQEQNTMSLEIVRVSQQGKDQMSRLKRLTGIKNWNVLCRWALCISLADETTPLVREINTHSNIEMSWSTFAGPYGDAYKSLLALRRETDNLDSDEWPLSRILSMHMHRGLGALSSKHDYNSIESLVCSSI